MNTKYDVGENRTHYISFVGYVALYPLSRKATTHSSSGGSYTRWGKRASRPHGKRDAGKKNRFQFGNDANLEMLSLIYAFKLSICQAPRLEWAYTAQNSKKMHFSLVSLRVRPRVYTAVAGSSCRQRFLAHAVHSSSHNPGS